MCVVFVSLNLKMTGSIETYVSVHGGLFVNAGTFMSAVFVSLAIDWFCDGISQGSKICPCPWYLYPCS